MVAKIVTLLGATGLVGGYCLDSLLQESAYQQVNILVRKKIEKSHMKLVQHVVDFECLEQFSDLFRVDDVFCCLGTTIQKAGTQEAFYKVDYEYCYESAKLASQHQCQRFLLITAMGSDSTSRIFYNRVKGELETAVRSLQFPQLYIFRPSLLLGDRKEFRFGEKIASVISKPISHLMIGAMKKYRPIQAQQVAKAMVKVARQKNQNGVHILLSDEIARLGK